MNTLVTDDMKQAGNRIASLLYDASVLKVVSHDSLDDFLNKIEYKDLIEDYLNNKIDSVTAIYLAMHRAK